jgi:hypothetical protein
MSHARFKDLSHFLGVKVALDFGNWIYFFPNVKNSVVDPDIIERFCIWELFFRAN